MTACKSPTQPSTAGSYLVTNTPIDTGVTSPALCIAVDTSQADGVWWWQPGRNGCASRSTGPGLFRGMHVTASGAPPGAVVVSFQLQLIDVDHAAGRTADVILTLEDQYMRAQASGARVPTHRRSVTSISILAHNLGGTIPTWSPDGAWIAYQTDIDVRPSVRTVRVIACSRQSTSRWTRTAMGGTARWCGLATARGSTQSGEPTTASCRSSRSTSELARSVSSARWAQTSISRRAIPMTMHESDRLEAA